MVLCLSKKTLKYYNQNREMIFRLLRREHEKGRGILLITHDDDTAAQANTRYNLIGGKLEVP